MTKGVKLINNGQRKIQFGNHPTHILEPKKAGVFTPETALKLKKLYKNELVSVDDIQTQFDQTQASDNTEASLSNDAPAEEAVSNDTDESDGSDNEADTQSDDAEESAPAEEATRRGRPKKFGR